MEPYAIVNRDRFPLVVVTFTGAKATPTNFQYYLDELRANYDREQPLALVFDAALAKVPGIAYQKKQGEWMRDHQGFIEMYCQGIAYVIPSTVIRNVLKLIFKIQRDPVPNQVFSNREEGTAWAQAQLDADRHQVG
ncbi:STAS/SEC14 domain-containing protein [Tunicatimonas pelagia]|uniref:STAS/SEC14 domain-containing protein n=1 Tax=Tunicatimonas pelagia TaxID=931531 RepID=UPI00266523C3|nr:STAS/SEC14 domain-containing protein [Tunicatimonas pelagia]WKN40971.1 STAS/SEC14 domain-containing protein [Tunicatimonas pelagia]